MTINAHQARTKKVVVGAVSITISQVIASLLAFILTGILSRAFTPDQFGLWSLLMTFTASFLGFDLGFGNALRNRLSRAYSKNEASEKSRGYFLSVFYIFIALSVVVGLLAVVIKPYIPWMSFLKTHDLPLVGDGASLFVIGVSVTALSLGFGLNAAGFFSYQESHWNAFSSLFSKAAILLVAVIFVNLKFSFFSINLSFFIITLVSSVLAFWLFMKKRNWPFTPIPFDTVRANTRELWRKSLQFAALQFIAFVFVSVDLFIVSKLFGLDIVGEYSLVKKLYMLVAYFHFAFLMPIWSAYTEAAEAGDIAWIKKILGKTLLYTSIIFVFAGICAVSFGEKFIYMWSGKTIMNRGLYLLLGVWALLTGVTNCFSVFLNSIGKLKWQILSGLLGIIVMFPLALWGGRIWGIDGICLALIVSNVPLALATSIQTQHYFKKFKVVVF